MMVRVALAFAMAFAMPAAARAATVVVKSSSFDSLGFRWGTVIYAPGQVSATMKMGRIQLQGVDPGSGDPLSYMSYALDILHPLQQGGFELQSLPPLIANPVKLSQIKALMSHADPAANSANKSAAIQMALWEIVYEPATTRYNVVSGQFRVRGGDSGTARTLANFYLSNIERNIWAPDKTQRFAGLVAAGNQMQLVRDAAIPEPATWAMLIAGFAGIGSALRRKRALASA